MQQGVLKFSFTVTREKKPVWDDPHLLGSPIGFGMRDLPLFEGVLKYARAIGSWDGKEVLRV